MAQAEEAAGKKKKNKNAGSEDAGGEKKAKDNGAQEKKKNKDAPFTVVLNVDMHCEGCAKKVRRSLKDFPGVETLTTDVSTNKLTVVGKVDALKLRERVESKTRRKVTIISPVIASNSSNAKKKDSENEKEKGPKNKGVGPNEKVKGKVMAVVKMMKEDEDEEEDESEEEEEEENEKLKRKGKAKATQEKKAKETEETKGKAEKKKPQQQITGKPKEVAVSTAVMRMGLHCEGCTKRIRKTISKIKGVESVAIDSTNELVMVRGTMDVKEMECQMKEKLKRSFEIIPPKRDNTKKDKRGIVIDGEEANDDDNEKDMKVGGKSDSGGKKKGGDNNGKKKDKEIDAGRLFLGASKVEYYGGGLNPCGYYAGGYGPYGYQMEAAHAPQIFSDENPNACSIM